MEENRYKRLITLFINRVYTLEMMNVFDGKEQEKLKIYKKDSEKYYHYMFAQPVKKGVFGIWEDLIDNSENDDINNIIYELCLNKRKNEVVLIYYVKCDYAFNKDYITRAAMYIFKKYGFEKYVFDNKPIIKRYNCFLKFKAIIDENMEISNVFEALDKLEILSKNSKLACYCNSYNDFLKKIFEKKGEK